MANGLIGTGIATRQRASQLFDQAAQGEQRREEVYQGMKQADDAQKMQMAGLGAAVGMSAGAQAGSVGGPWGALIGAGVGYLAGELL